MSIPDFTALIAAMAPADILSNVKAWTEDPVAADAPDVAAWLANLAQTAPDTISDLDLRALRIACYCLARTRNHNCFQDLVNVLALPALQAVITPTDWIIPNLSRILGSIATPENVGALEAMSLNTAYTTEMREQALLTIHFLWLENIITVDVITESYRKTIAAALSYDKLEGRMATALALNAAVVGGASLRSEVAAILDTGAIGEQTEMIAKAVQAIMTDNRQFRAIYQRQHKSFFDKAEDEIPNINSPLIEETPEMPHKGTPITRSQPKIGRNDPCPCGSGKKYKKCCGKNL